MIDKKFDRENSQGKLLQKIFLIIKFMIFVIKIEVLLNHRTNRI